MTGDERPGLGGRGWILIVATILTCLAFPALFLVAPPTWLSYHVAFLALPVLPAAALGLIAVWAAFAAPPT